MLIAAAVCPYPPLMVAGIGPPDDVRLDDVRAACWSALDDLRATSPDVLVVVGPGETTADEAPRAGSLAPYGVDLSVALPGDEAPHNEQTMPLSVSVGAWLLQRDGWDGLVTAATVAGDAGDGDCVELGRRIAGRADRVALLVMADGSPLRADTTPHEQRTKAQTYDAELATALRDGDPQRLLDLDAALAAEVGSPGRKALRVLAGAADDGLFDAEVTYDDAPYGVGYLVGVWERHG
ncbi:class III extradiol ring-cleavage dioxygenase family protein [Jiangella alkaliphila]|uniref:Catalytic LigB subunit of aromatic ring-opening dioxygenase n=1 Tax=Jiangella alkaliphila TaxID=419479 RepID=A0A1H2L5K4_9ACTN|nr:hypothetical protein [Jiangella alkaliphila]SDU76015.1 hypothetical protein SAMN04488563_5086 [Jiangella alkaliphila]